MPVGCWLVAGWLLELVARSARKQVWERRETGPGAQGNMPGSAGKQAQECEASTWQDAFNKALVPFIVKFDTTAC